MFHYYKIFQSTAVECLKLHKLDWTVCSNYPDYILNKSGGCFV